MLFKLRIVNLRLVSVVMSCSVQSHAYVKPITATGPLQIDLFRDVTDIIINLHVKKLPSSHNIYKNAGGLFRKKNQQGKNTDPGDILNRYWQRE
jgi:hypothetical protein